MTVTSNASSSTLLRNAALAAMLVSATLGFTLFRPPPTAGPFGRDFEAYEAAGAAVNAGRNPYSRDVWTFERRIAGVDASHDELLPFVGPAASLPLWAALARLPYRAALAIWTALLVGALLTVVWSALRLAGVSDVRSVAAAGAFALTSAPAISAIALAQVALLSAGALALAIVAYRARSATGAFAATLFAALQPNLALPLLARMRARRDVAIAVAAASVYLALTLAAGGGPAGIARYAHYLAAHAAAERLAAIQYTPAAILFSLGLEPRVALACGVTIACLAAAAAVALIVRARLGPTAATLTACALLPAGVPFFHEHDFIVELLPALFLAAAAHGRTRAVAAVAAVLVGVDWFGLAQRPAASAQILALGACVALGSMALCSTRRDAAFAALGPAALALIAAAALPLAGAHPAPTWPDALPVHFRAAPAADVSAVWESEQRAAGLERADPVWGALRALPLCGSLTLAGALVAHARRRRRYVPDAPDSTFIMSSNGET